MPINNNNLKNKNIFFNPLLNKPKSAFGNKNILSNNNKALTSSDKNKKKLIEIKVLYLEIMKIVIK